jgi:hypothetical protein
MGPEASHFGHVITPVEIALGSILSTRIRCPHLRH